MKDAVANRCYGESLPVGRLQVWVCSIVLQSISECVYFDTLRVLTSSRLFRSSRQVCVVVSGGGNFKGIILPPLT